MERYLLFIRDVGENDQAIIHPSEPEARRTLAQYVRLRLCTRDSTALLDDEEAIDAYFASDAADCVIASISKPAQRGSVLS